MSEDERKIKLGGGYWLVNDPYCYWIAKEYEYKKGKHIGEIYLKRVSGYTANITDALEGFCESHIREIEARSVKTLIKEVKSLKTLVKGFREQIK